MPIEPWAIDASAGAPAYNAGEMRLLTTTPFLAGAGVSLGARSGVRPSGSGTDLLVQAQASPNMSVQIRTGIVIVQGSISATQGAYTWALDAVTNVTIAAAHATLTRTDLIVVRIRDAGVDTSGGRDGQPIVITGTAGGGVPTLPTDATYFTLAQIAVGAAVTTIVAGNITDKRVFTTGLGGILPCNATTEPAATTIPAGQIVYRTDIGQYKSSDGAAYQHLAWSPPYMVAVKPTDDASLVSTALKDDTHLFFNNLPVNSKWMLTSNVFYYADVTADFKMGWSGPAGATLLWNFGGMESAAASATGAAYYATNSITGTDIAGGAGAPLPVLVTRPSGLLTIGGTSGKLQFRWAQAVSTVNGVNTLKDGWMKLDRVG